MLASAEDLRPFRLIRIVSSVGGDVDLTKDTDSHPTNPIAPGYASRIYSVGGATLVLNMTGDGGTASTLVLAAKEFRDGQFTKITASGSSITGNLEISWR